MNGAYPNPDPPRSAGTAPRTLPQGDAHSPPEPRHQNKRAAERRRLARLDHDRSLKADRRAGPSGDVSVATLTTTNERRIRGNPLDDRKPTRLRCASTCPLTSATGSFFHPCVYVSFRGEAVVRSTVYGRFVPDPEQAFADRQGTGGICATMIWGSSCFTASAAQARNLFTTRAEKRRLASISGDCGIPPAVQLGGDAAEAPARWPLAECSLAWWMRDTWHAARPFASQLLARGNDSRHLAQGLLHGGSW